jgi:membrane associated rhomboid family serine protease
VLLLLLAGSRARSWVVVASIIFLGGGLVWLFGRPAIHIGASGLIYGLIAYLIVAGICERRMVPMLISIIVGFFYGGTLATGILPTAGQQISWEGHLLGAAAGAIVAYVMTRPPDHDQCQ